VGTGRTKRKTVQSNGDRPGMHRNCGRPRRRAEVVAMTGRRGILGAPRRLDFAPAIRYLQHRRRV
jgi:hypothetical protein